MELLKKGSWGTAQVYSSNKELSGGGGGVALRSGRGARLGGRGCAVGSVTCVMVEQVVTIENAL